MERKPYYQRVFEDLVRSMCLFQHIGDPAKTFNLHWGRLHHGAWPGEGS